MALKQQILLGSFEFPIPIANVTAPTILAPSKSAPTAPNNTPTASPSGILCSVIASTSKIVFFHFVFGPSASDSLKLMCKCGSNFI